jgi:protein-disulfide isomerase
MKNQPKNNSLTPLIIIGLVLLVAVVGGWWLYKSSTAPRPPRANTNTTNRTSTPDNSVDKYATAPPGAQPPNMLGSQTATVTVEEFADFQCPTCAKMHPLSKEIIATYGPRIKFIFRNFPLAIAAHDKAYDAAVAAEAAREQGKFWDMQNQLFSNQQSWTTSTDFRKVLEEYAQKIGLDVEKFKSDMAGMTAKTRVDADLQRGRGVGVSSTPTFFINGKAVPFEQMTSETMRAIIDAELQKAQTANQTVPAANQANTNTANK